MLKIKVEVILRYLYILECDLVSKLLCSLVFPHATSMQCAMISGLVVTYAVRCIHHKFILWP